MAVGTSRRSTVAFLAPSVGLIGAFILVPIALTIWLSFQSWSTQTAFATAVPTGLDNYRLLLSGDPVGRDFRQAGTNTLTYAVLSVGTILPLAIAFGTFVHRASVRGVVLLRSVLFATYIVPTIAIAIVWSKLYSPSEGPFNQILGVVGVAPRTWLSDPSTALNALVVLNVWQQVGYFTVLVVAGLTQIPGDVYEAAAIDGARGIALFRRITLPLLRPTVLFVSVIALINAVQVFEPVAAITQGGPAGATNVLTFHIRRVGIERAQGGVGSAMAVMLLLALVVTVALVFALLHRQDER
jgi:multiple sugar transport system permease protein